MQPDTGKIDQVLQYALLTASQEDDYKDRDLGPIHLLKYVYLADLAYAERYEGKGYTGIRWQFYKFGPWSQVAHERIENALSSIHAQKQNYASHYGNDDWTRWSLRDDQRLQEIEEQLPYTISHRIKRDVHKYGKDTPSLLDYVYKTPPMLSAKPLDYLDFGLCAPPTQESSEPEMTKFDKLSNKKKKQFSQKIKALPERLKNSQFTQRKRLINPVKVKLYEDKVFAEGVSWLEKLAGKEFPKGTSTVRFADEVWQSMTRKGEDVS